MKRTAMATVLLAAFGMVIPAPRAEAQVSVSVTIGGFYDELSPYGEWIDCTYGECWVPRGVGAGWQPYTSGHWIYTRYGWTWVSTDPWGSNPYHYGTWTFLGRHGWVWVPGTVWAPAWVTWCFSDRYVGWAPMPPTTAFGSAGYSGRPIVVNQTQYVFVPTNRFVDTNVTSVRVEPQRNAEIFRQAKAVTRFDVSGGVVRNVAVPLSTVQRAMGSKIETREISTANTTPQKVSAGGARSGRVAIVAPARDVKAARTSRQPAAPAQPQQHQQQPKAQQQAHPQHQQQPKVQQQQQAQPQHPQQQAQPQHRQEPKAQQQAQPQHQQQPRAQEQVQQQHQQQPKVQQVPAQPQPQQQPKVQQQQPAQPQHQQQPSEVKPQQGHEKTEQHGQGKDKDKKD